MSDTITNGLPAQVSSLRAVLYTDDDIRPALNAEQWQHLEFSAGAPPWWALPVPAWERDAWLEVRDRAWWVALWWRVIEGPFWRILTALGVWETSEGGYFRRGRPTWANRYVRRVPEFPRDGREFWRYVWRGDLPSDLKAADWARLEQRIIEAGWRT